MGSPKENKWTEATPQLLKLYTTSSKALLFLPLQTTHTRGTIFHVLQLLQLNINSFIVFGIAQEDFKPS